MKPGDSGTIGDVIKITEVIDEKTAIAKIGGGVFGLSGLPTSNWTAGSKIKSDRYVVVTSPQEFDTAGGKKKLRAIVGLETEGVETWRALANLSKFPIAESREFTIGMAKVSGIFVQMHNENVGILTLGDETPEYRPLTAFSEDDQKWIREKIREYANKKK